MTSYSHDMTFHRESGRNVCSKHLNKLTCILYVRFLDFAGQGVLVYLKEYINTK